MRTTILTLCLLLSGCGVSFFTAKTTASYEVSADGKKLFYESNKDYQGLDAEYDVKTGSFRVHVDKSGTPEAAIAAALQQQIQFMEILKPLIEKAAAGMK